MPHLPRHSLHLSSEHMGYIYSNNIQSNTISSTVLKSDIVNSSVIETEEVSKILIETTLAPSEQKKIKFKDIIEKTNSVGLIGVQLTNNNIRQGTVALYTISKIFDNFTIGVISESSNTRVGLISLNSQNLELSITNTSLEHITLKLNKLNIL